MIGDHAAPKRMESGVAAEATVHREGGPIEWSGRPMWSGSGRVKNTGTASVRRSVWIWFCVDANRSNRDSKLIFRLGITLRRRCANREKSLPLICL